MTYPAQRPGSAWKRLSIHCALFAVGLLWATDLVAAELEVRIDNPPEDGVVIAMLFDSAATFVDLRDPVATLTLSAGGAEPGIIADLPAGEYALLVYQDENGNGRLDKNFIGIPREPLGFSNRYWAKGPPVFSGAAFRLGGEETKRVDVELKSIFGDLGVLGLGAGVIAKTSPYRDADSVEVRPIPAISYVGDRVQVLGLKAQCGLVSNDDLALAATARYRFGAYEEDDSDYLEGLGDRDDTVMAGLALQAELPAGLELSAGYEHDLLSRSNGGRGRLAVDKSFQRGRLTVTPQLALNWLDADLTDYEYGVPAAKARAGRPAYAPGDAVEFEAGLLMLRELRDDWQIVFAGSVTLLPSELTDSPIVERSEVFGGFFAVNRLF